VCPHIGEDEWDNDGVCGDADPCPQDTVTAARSTVSATARTLTAMADNDLDTDCRCDNRCQALKLDPGRLRCCGRLPVCRLQRLVPEVVCKVAPPANVWLEVLPHAHK
jgi:hypothetical protein